MNIKFMNFKFLLVLCATTLMIGCSKCSQTQPEPPPPAAEPVTEQMPTDDSITVVPGEEAPGAAPEGSEQPLPDAEEMNQELPPDEETKNKGN